MNGVNADMHLRYGGEFQSRHSDAQELYSEAFEKELIPWP